MSNSTQTPEAPSSNATQHRERPAGWLIAVGLAVVLLLILVVNQWRGEQSSEVGSGAAETDKLLQSDHALGVTLAAEGGAMDLRPIIVVHRPRMTVLEAMQLASRADSSWAFAYDGRDELVFITRLAGQTNQGEAGLNWQYDVNGQRAELGAAQQPVEPGDRVLWKFAAYE